MAKGGTTYTTFEAEFQHLQEKAEEVANNGGDYNDFILRNLAGMRKTAELLGPAAVQDYEANLAQFMATKNGGLHGMLADSADAQAAKIIADKQQSDEAAKKEKNKKRGYAGWESTYKQLYGGDKNIDKNKVFLRDKVILPAAAGAANGIANVTNSVAGANAAKHSILGNAMQAMHNTSVFNDLAAQTRAAREANYNTRRAAREQMKAATINGISNAIGSGLNAAAGIANQLAYNESAAVDKAQAATMQKNEQPTGDFYRNEMQMRRFSREDNR